MKTKLFVSKRTAWEAVLRRDRRYDGAFVYAAVTTGIYCRPSCPARSPRFRNTLILRSATDAERQGYAACLRCHPGHSLTPTEGKIRAALEHIDAHFDQVITLGTLSQLSHVSAHHLRETFKKIVGLSPKAYRDACRMAGFKRLLRSGASITNACYEAGFGSSRALYERTGQSLGMTPAAYQRGGSGARIRFTICNSSCGPLLIARTGVGVCSILIGENADVLAGQLKKEFPLACLEQRTVADCRELRTMCGLSEDPFLLKLPTEIRQRIFQARLSNALK
jgi:AraC family transcriptional regulator of adaptative response/methylated-DNA-[protein]-cysteine methyltransferase